MPELRYYLAPMLTGLLYGTAPHRTHPFFRSRLNPSGPQVAHVSMMPLGKRDVGILAVTAEPVEHDAFVAAGAGVELPHRRNFRLTDMSKIRDVLPLTLLDSRISAGTPGWQAIRYLGRTAQFLQRVHGQFGADLLDADRTRFAELGERYAALKDEPDFRTRLEGAVDLWPELLPLRLGVGVDLGFEPLVQGGALPGSDAFTNSNGTNLSTHNSLWVQLGGGTAWTIQSNQARVPIDSARRFAYWNETWANDQWARATASNRGTYSQGPAVRIQTSGVNGVEWSAELWNGSGIYLTVVVGGSGTDIDEYLSGASAGVILELQAEGTTFRGYTGSTPTERANATDSTYSSGKGGMAGYNDPASNGVYLDNWAGDNLSGSGPTTLTPAAVAIPVVAPAVTISRTLTLTPSPVAVPVATPAPTLQLTTTIAPSPVTVPLVEPAPTLSMGTLTLAPGAVAVPVLAPAPTLALVYTLAPDAVAVPVSEPAPTLVFALALTPGAVTVPVVVPDPAVSSGATLAPDPVQIAVVEPAPTIVRTLTLAPSPVTVPVAAPDPALVGAGSLAPSPVAVVVAVPAPSVVPGTKTLTPDPAQVAVTVPAPQFAGSLPLSPSPVAVAVAPVAPSVQRTLELAPGAVAVPVAVPAPVIVVDRVLTPGAVAIVVVLPLVGISGDLVVVYVIGAARHAPVATGSARHAARAEGQARHG